MSNMRKSYDCGSLRSIFFAKGDVIQEIVLYFSSFSASLDKITNAGTNVGADSNPTALIGH